MTLTAQIKKGMYIDYKDEPHYIVEAQFSRQGRVSAFTRTKLKSLITGKVVSVTYDSGQKVDEIDISTRTMQYMYSDEEKVYLMDKDTFEQYEIEREIVGDVIKFLKEGDDTITRFYEEKPIAMEVKPKVELEVVSTMSAVKGNTSGNAQKDAELETGFVAQVPLFIKNGDRIIVNTETGDYVGKA
ncbi:MAG TPA: elongation factor P [Candidatus Dojkabacteria bacterium]|jgi:elongation factor P